VNVGLAIDEAVVGKVAPNLLIDALETGIGESHDARASETRIEPSGLLLVRVEP
jgi:hypothetical protein